MLGAVSKQKLYYEVYQDAAHQNIWGNTPNPGGNEVCGTGNASVTFYGLIAAGQNPPPDTYTDSLSTDTTQFTVTEVVVKACSISATNLAFGTYVGTLINSTSTISVTCTNTTTYTVGLSAGASGNVAARTMKNGTHILNYALYQNSTHTTNWGNTTNMEAGTGNGALQALTVYGQLPAGTVPAAGNYTDTITATITY
jgi:spore coat protein U-like protein